MSWVAQCYSNPIEVGSRMYIQEAMHAPGHPRPKYKAGDRFDISRGNTFVDRAKIVAVQSNMIDVEMQSGQVLTLSPTQYGASAATLQSDIPFEDWTVTAVK